MLITMKKMDKPVKEIRTCSECGRKKTFVYVYQANLGGIWTEDNQPCMPFMICPRCKKRTMIREEK